MGDPLAALQAALAGRYRLEGQVGKGGMGVVYLAQDLKHGRAVAIKVLRPEVAAALGHDRFLREIGIAAQLSHPHVVPLHDSGDANGHLYYVMPFVPGETLRDRLEREGKLSSDEAIRITRQVASALAHAHSRGVIHRDIKPSNILLSEGFALVADFGLARALSGASEGADISSVGLPIGTPRYMSPEQAMGAREIDGRSDLYALGRVLQEMLQGLPAGDTPSRGKAGPAQPQLPAALERVVTRCIAPSPADRYASADELIAALGLPAAGPVDRRWLKTAGIAAAGVLVAWAGWRVSQAVRLGSGTAVIDTTRFTVLPFDRQPGTPDLRADVPIRTALARWTGISVVSGVQVNEALQRRQGAALDRQSARRIAEQMGAGRFVLGQVVPFGDSIQVEAVLFDTRAGSLVVEKTVRLPRNLAGADSLMPRLADSLLFQGAVPVEHFPAPPGTSSVPAMLEFIRARAAVDRWDLAEADSGFGRAVSLDPTFARGFLWLAQVRAWQRQPAQTWRTAAANAAAGTARLGPRDVALAEALAAMSRGEYATACPQWLQLTHQWPQEFPVWYGAATCLSRDAAVARAPRSPTGWKFRSSYHQVQLAWRQAFTLLPAIYRDYRAGGLRGPSWLLWTENNRARNGFALPPDSGVFLSWPTWEGDSLAFVPRRMADFTSGRAISTKATAEVVTRQRLAFYDLATEWASSDPRNVEAREAVALALWSLGNPAAIDSIRTTRALARSSGDRSRLGVSEALMRMLQAPESPREMAVVRALTDSILQLDPHSLDIDPWDLATIAALTGRATLAARLIRIASPRSAWHLPPALTSDAQALLVFAALGGPLDSLRVLEARVGDGIATGVNSERQVAERAEWLGRPLALIALDVPLPSFEQLVGTGDYLIDAEAAYRRGDTAKVLQLLGITADSRSGMKASELMFEALLPESRLFAAMGHRAKAIGRLDPTFQDLRHVALSLVNDPVGAALLIRAMAFRADLAASSGDSTTARKWGRTVSVLWSEADPFLAPVLQRMQRLAGNQ